MFRSLALSIVVGLTVVLGFAGDASAQRHDDDRFFFLRDPFGRGRSLFDFPERRAAPPRRRKTHVEPPPREPAGTVYNSSADADEQRFVSASEYVLVLGDTLADQLSQGLADEFVAERPEVAIVKKTNANSSYVRKDYYDWVGEAPSLLAKEKPTAIVVMLGINDRQPIRDDSGSYEFRSDRWKELYGKRVEEFLNKLKVKNVPIFVVGMPPLRSPRMTLDMIYLNEIVSARTQKIGGYYIDIWDGFVTEDGDYMATGPALDGQTRRLRSSDGIHFTKAGQRKLAHYAERELVRLFDSRPGLKPVTPQNSTPGIAAKPGAAGEAVAPAARPLAGPVLPLSQDSGPAGALAGAPAPNGRQTKIKLPTDPGLARTLIEGKPSDPVAGRADDFRWPRPEAKAETAPEAADTAKAPPSAPLRPVLAPPKGKDGASPR